MISLKVDNDAPASPKLDPVQNSHRARPADSLADLAKVIEMVGTRGFSTL